MFRLSRSAFILAALGLCLGACVGSIGAASAEEATSLPPVAWPFSGIFGTYDRAALQRGFQVYKEVCSVCHGVNQIHYRNLAALGFNEDEIKAIAAEVQVSDGPNDSGDMFERPGRPSDPFKAPFANEEAARAANNGALPPDLSLITKAREGGPTYIHALLTGFKDAPAGFKLGDGMYYNEYFPGHQIAMPPPLSDGQVSYADGTKASVDQMAKDVTSFLNWAAEPELETRHRMGVKVVLFLIVLTGMLYAVKRKVWQDVH